MDDGFIINLGDNKHPKKKTLGRELITKMKKGFSKWVSPKDINEINSIKITKYLVANKIDHEPAFAW